MTITLELDAELSAWLREKAEEIGADEASLALAYLRDGMRSALVDDSDAELTEEDKAAIRQGIDRGLEAFEQGRYRSLEAIINEKRDRYGLDI